MCVLLSVKKASESKHTAMAGMEKIDMKANIEAVRDAYVSTEQTCILSHVNVNT